MPKTMSHLSKDDILIPVQVLVSEGGNATVTTDAVAFAFTLGTTTPTPTDWHTGFWLNTGSRLFAGITVGPGAVVLNPGTYNVWLKVSDTPTIPVASVDTLVIQ